LHDYIGERANARGEFYAPDMERWLYLSCTVTPESVIILFYDITDIKRSEEKLEGEYRRFKEAELLAHVGSFELELDSGKMTFSDEIYRILGHKPQSIEASQHLLDSATHPDDLPRIREQIQEGMRKAEAFEYIRRVIRPDGSLRYVQTRNKALLNSNGEPVKLIGSVLDITSSKIARTRLEESAALLKKAELLAKTGSYEIMLPSWTCRFSEGMFRLFGYEPDGIEPSLAFIDSVSHPDDVEKVRAILEHALENAEEYNYGRRIYHSNGEIRYLEARGVVIRDESGQPRKLMGTVQDITDQIKARAELTDKETFINQITNATPDLIYLLDLETTQILYINDRVKDVLGQNPADVYRKGNRIFEEILHPEDFSKRMQHIKSLVHIKEGEVWEMDLRVRAADKSWRWFRTRDSVFRKNEQGNVIQTIGTAQDITEQRLAEERLIELLNELEIRNKQHEHTEEIAVLGTWTWSLDTNKATVSDNIFRLFGLNPYEVEPRFENAARFIHSQDWEKLLYYASTINAGQAPAGIEFRAIRADGQERIMRNRCRLVITEGGERLLVGTTQDITEEASLRQELMERTRYAEAIIDASPDRIAVYDRELRIIAWNRRSEETSGRPRQSLLGKKLLEEFPRLSEDRELITAYQEVFGGHHVQLPAKKGLHDQSYYERFLMPLKDESGYTYAIVSIMHDVSRLVHRNQELKELNKSLAKKTRELEEKSEEITNFAFVASHDLKEPLRKIHTFSDWLLEKEMAQLSPTGKTYTNKINNAVRRMEMLIDDILALTKIHSDRHKEEGVDLNAVFRQVMADMHDVVRQTKTRVEADVLPSISGNKNQLFYLFRNLLSNAIKFQHPDNIPHVRITAEVVQGNEVSILNAREEYLRLCFADNGLGLDPRYVKKIFQVFQRLHGRDEYEGTGMGLAICRKIMENHEGIITVASEPGEGATFCCFFPL
ncbi:MAG TPA: PAS domain-containing protein, partial [Flavisolibacter sp.]|nr:PAS domain-containing protein [Flavisolibacter sp.]